MSWDSPISVKDAVNSIGFVAQFVLGYPRVLGCSVNTIVLNFHTVVFSKPFVNNKIDMPNLC